MALGKNPTLNYGFTAKTCGKLNYSLQFYFSQQAHSNIYIYNKLQQTAILAHSFLSSYTVCTLSVYEATNFNPRFVEAIDDLVQNYKMGAYT
jgi:hypothetical protein